MPAYSITIRGDLTAANLAFARHLQPRLAAMPHRMTIGHSNPHDTTVLIMCCRNLLPTIHEWWNEANADDSYGAFKDGTLLFFRAWSDAALAQATENGSEAYAEAKAEGVNDGIATVHGNRAAANDLDLTNMRTVEWLLHGDLHAATGFQG